MIEGKSVYLRALEPEDLESLYIWENDLQVWQVSSTLMPMSRYILKRYIESASIDPFEGGQLRLMIIERESDRAIGAIDLFEIDTVNRRAGVGILIYERSDRGRGYAAEALELLTSYTKRTLGLHQLFCNITPDNLVSIELFTKQGFKQVGLKKEWIFVDGEWRDEMLLQKIL